MVKCLLDPCFCVVLRSLSNAFLPITSFYLYNSPGWQTRQGGLSPINWNESRGAERQRSHFWLWSLIWWNHVKASCREAQWLWLIFIPYFDTTFFMFEDNSLCSHLRIYNLFYFHLHLEFWYSLFQLLAFLMCYVSWGLGLISSLLIESLLHYFSYLSLNRPSGHCLSWTGLQP